MAFSIGYVGVCRGNIQHLYTTRTLKPPATRKTPHYQPGFLNDLDADRKQRLRNRPFMEYNSKYGIEIPKAPSYRNVQREQVDEIVKRLTMLPKDRFDFKHTDHLRYNDWQTAHFKKIQHLRETVVKFGSHKDYHDDRSPEVTKVKRKRKRRKKTIKQKEGGETLPEV